MNYFHRFIFVPIIYPISVPVMSSSSEPEGLIRLGRIKLPNISPVDYSQYRYFISRKSLWGRSIIMQGSFKHFSRQALKSYFPAHFNI